MDHHLAAIGQYVPNFSADSTDAKYMQQSKAKKAVKKGSTVVSGPVYPVPGFVYAPPVHLTCAVCCTCLRLQGYRLAAVQYH